MIDITTYILAREATKAIIDEEGGIGSKVVNVESSSGHLDQDTLDILKKSPSNLIVVDKKIYRLSRIEGNNYKYINSLTDSTSQFVKMSELDVNQETGDFSTKVLTIEGQSVEQLRLEFEAHRDNNVIHVTSADRSK